MTAQQIEYWKLKEGERANQAAEAENRRYHKANETLQSQLNSENARHNRAVEAINRANLDIAARNAATNALNAATNARLAELQRLRDAETLRHNQMVESIDQSYKTSMVELENKKLDQNYLIASEDRAAANTRSYVSSGSGIVEKLLPGILGLSVGKAIGSKSAATVGAGVIGATIPSPVKAVLLAGTTSYLIADKAQRADVSIVTKHGVTGLSHNYYPDYTSSSGTSHYGSGQTFEPYVGSKKRSNNSN